ncbi:unnamed protein product [Ceratitis capitata]|uniref:(Mediterranean fruit fly) hypothetical protein n=1 Tax=Ceratitis capitata TaxID=7213 RepID=A0A811VHU8_CERCA|nr:unnamed protein product [Ceratitis capitata]
MATCNSNYLPEYAMLHVGKSKIQHSRALSRESASCYDSNIDFDMKNCAVGLQAYPWLQKGPSSCHSNATAAATIHIHHVVSVKVFTQFLLLLLLLHCTV